MTFILIFADVFAMPIALTHEGHAVTTVSAPVATTSSTLRRAIV